MIFLKPVNENLPCPEQLLSRFFQLTPAESRLACKIANGKTLKEIAAEHRITDNTARSQLKAIFSKMGINKQTNLVKEILTLTMGLNRESY